MFDKILAKIEQYDRIIIHRHNFPDGDAIGSQVGLKFIIKANYPQKAVFIVGDDPKNYSFIEGSMPDDVPSEAYDDALAIILDSAATHLISDDRYANAKERLRLDHHNFCEIIAETEFVDTSYESCCGIICDFAMQNNLDIPTIAAKALYTGLVTDSGRFRYDSTTGRTFTFAQHLLKQNFSLEEVYTTLYADDFSKIKLRAHYVLKINFTAQNVAYIYTDYAELQKLGVDSFTISRGMVGVMADIKDVSIWVNFTETEKGVLCELRSNKYNINPIAVSYGGGGHNKASGACLESKAQAMKMLDDLDKLTIQSNEV